MLFAKPLASAWMRAYFNEGDAFGGLILVSNLLFMICKPPEPRRKVGCHYFGFRGNFVIFGESLDARLDFEQETDQ